MSSKRYLSLDLFRGCAILGVVLVHGLIFGIFSTIEIALNILPLPFLIFLSPIVIFAPMAGLFVFISSIANSMVLHKHLQQGYSLKTSLQPVLVTSIALMFLHFIFPAFFNHSNSSMFHPELSLDGMIPASILKGELVLPRFENLLLMDATAMISLAGFFFVILSWVLFRKGYKVTDRLIRNLIIFGCLWVFAAPFVWGVFWKLLNFFYFQEGFTRLFSIPVSLFGAKIHPITTIAPFAIFGMGFALLLSTEPEYPILRRKTLRWGFLMLFLMLISLGGKAFLCFGKESTLYHILEKSGIVSWLAMNTPPPEPLVDATPSLIAGDLKNSIFNFQVLPPELLFLGITICFFFFPIFVKKLDYQTDERKIHLAHKIAPLQRFGTASLTIFFMESLVFAILSKLFHHFIPEKGSEPTWMSWLYESPFWLDGKIDVEGATAFMHIWPFWILYIVLLIGFWGYTLKLWESFHYKYSLEWFLVQGTKPFRKIRSSKMDVLDDRRAYIQEERQERE